METIKFKGKLTSGKKKQKYARCIIVGIFNFTASTSANKSKLIRGTQNVKREKRLEEEAGARDSGPAPVGSHGHSRNQQRRGPHLFTFHIPPRSLFVNNI